jgi:hypothetical protein
MIFRTSPIQYTKEGSFNSNVVMPLMKLSMYQSIETHASQEKKLTPIVGALHTTTMCK